VVGHHARINSGEHCQTLTRRITVPFEIRSMFTTARKALGTENHSASSIELLIPSAKQHVFALFTTRHFSRRRHLDRLSTGDGCDMPLQRNTSELLLAWRVWNSDPSVVAGRVWSPVSGYGSGWMSPRDNKGRF
jgi:hypothetical protein